MKTKTQTFKKTRKIRRNGFTLIEVIAVLVLLGIVTDLATPKYVDMWTAAQERGIDAGIAELNARETLVWANEQISEDGWQSDSEIRSLVDTEVGRHYSFPDGVSATGGSLSFQGNTAVPLNRAASTATSSAAWTRQ